jgi:uncharacterized membrane protein
MAQATDVSRTPGVLSTDVHDPIYQAYEVLRWGFTIAPILAGLDKFLHLLANWDQYLAPAIARMLPFSGHAFMLIVGIIEIVAGIGVFLKPRIFGYVVSAWLVCIIINLMISGTYLDVALRDLGLAIGAFALARLSERFESAPEK